MQSPLDRESRKIKVLTFVGYYLPGYKSGGPVRTIANMVDHLAGQAEFWVVTRDRDLGDALPFDLPAGQWVELAGAKVMYLPPEGFALDNLARIVRETPHDLLYLNSFFDSLCTIRVLLALALRKPSQAPVLLAPRGEFSAGALRLKRLKKALYIALFRLFPLGRRLHYQASSELEKQDIVAALGVPAANIEVAMDLPALKFAEAVAPARADERLRVVFLSRLSPKKNLDYALALLARVKAPLSFDIYGPQEDADYWQRCAALIEALPAHIECHYRGAVHPEQIAALLAGYDLFLFPTLGENYGHVIAESISAGTPVLISDQTPWRDLERAGLGWDLPLDDTAAFVARIEACAGVPLAERLARRTAVVEAARQRLVDPETVADNLRMLAEVAGSAAPVGRA